MQRASVRSGGGRGGGGSQGAFTSARRPGEKPRAKHAESLVHK